MNQPSTTPAPVATPSRTTQGRPASISRDELIDAALQLLGPHRSVSTLSLREIAREAGIAPNSFYRHFRDVDELAIALVDRAGSELRNIIGRARQRAATGRSVVQSSMEVFMEQLRAEQGYLQLLLREGKVGSDAFKQAVEQQLCFFENELKVDLIRLEQLHGNQLYAPELVAKAITRLVFAMGATAVEQDIAGQSVILEQTTDMIHMILRGARSMGSQPD
ncbi:HTH-type transcriptional repressor FabR [Alkanindiges sp. WGS2144]|uniref:HTH-type transcriptional repressor FabR n=1 Tax=Alkanindiges sp. WGS2144 TaxID=3366808 RepID=UPI003751A96C